MNIDDVDLPLIYCPVEGELNPATERVEARSAEWIDQHRLYDTEQERAWLLATKSADFCGRYYPEADEERLLATALWTYWAFAFDDNYCDNGETCDQPAKFAEVAGYVQRAWEVPTLLRSGDPRLDHYLVAMQDVSARFHRLGTPTQLQRMHAAHCAYLFGVQWQVSNRSRNVFPGLDGYLLMRRGAVGVGPLIAALEFAHRNEVPAAEWDSPAVRALTEMVIVVVALDNDRQSIVKELRLGQTEQNVFTALMGEGLSLEEAIAEATALRDRVFCRFLQVEEQARRGGSAALRRYLQGLRWAIRGNAEWGLTIPRYLSDGPLPETGSAPVDVDWAKQPAGHDGRPVPPSIAWWWQDLS
ncbi:hypothetical protein [Lentzea sp. HUAS12]|uniref:terpene synthase family protein n=1 Tax=Lentzea sp. HUAS12 TaxID=2951806 RepID=UPI00209F016A|nr:hypothetical protein [Lentzea sp. HUAS12]USX52828.1 hypothetical protein ND450_01645 [Lentzea sp. HUAS12]